MNDETITVDLQQLTTVIEQLENVNVELSEKERNNLNSINENLLDLVTYLTPEDLTEEELQQIKNIEIEEQEKEDLLYENINEIVQILQPEELTEEQLQEIESRETEEDRFNNSIESNLIDLNNNINHLTEVIETDINTYNELDDLQIKAYGSNIILMFVFIFALFAKGVFSIFSFFGNKI